MKTYKVKQTCVGMPFDPRYWEAGVIFEVEDDVDPASDNFELISGPAEKKSEVEEGTSYSEIQKKQAAISRPKTGFAASIEKEEDKPKVKSKKRGKK